MLFALCDLKAHGHNEVRNTECSNTVNMMFLRRTRGKMLTLDKIFTTASCTAFIHTRRYKQHKMKFLEGALIFLNNVEM